MSTTTLTDQEIAELERLEKAATPDWSLELHDQVSQWYGNIIGWYSRESRSVRTIACLTRYCRSIDERASNAMLIVAARNALPRLLDELKRLREVVAKMPKTADGVPIVPGMTVYRRTDGVTPLAFSVSASSLTKVTNPTVAGWVSSAKSYSTREAACAAESTEGVENE